METEKKLNQVIAIEKGAKSNAQKTITLAHRSNSHPALFNGSVKTYERSDDRGEELPDERQVVQCRVSDAIRDVREALSDMFDLTATKDWANCEARADVVVDEQTLLSNCPATYLLFLEKQLNDLRTFTLNIPVLDPAKDWTFDDSAGLFKSAPIQTNRTKKVDRPIVLYEATDKHPAQTQLITEDIVVGQYTMVYHSAAVREEQRDRYVRRINRLMRAVKEARETANMSPASRQQTADPIFDFIFGEDD
jgi:hypothetical protein